MRHKMWILSLVIILPEKGNLERVKITCTISFLSHISIVMIRMSMRSPVLFNLFLTKIMQWIPQDHHISISIGARQISNLQMELPYE
ncbi:hypothetical protein DPMN_001474 [Dreissena polymorpha]|uniref:Uncharacterized protein n=1 Tax=Dreissena polymorpha TaxID=45954 RepID=A0A9D4MKZ6_DREPO|nr:hypothetical protein DPMN_001474 [Dreissena polymorpha]